MADGTACGRRLSWHRHAAGLRVSSNARMAAKLGAAHRPRYGGKRRSARHRRHTRYARRPLARARQPRLGRAVARVAVGHERPGRDGLRALPVSGVVLQLGTRRPARGGVFQSVESLPRVDAAAEGSASVSCDGRHQPARHRRIEEGSGSVQPVARAVRDVRFDPWRRAVPDRGAARVPRIRCRSSCSR